MQFISSIVGGPPGTPSFLDGDDLSKLGKGQVLSSRPGTSGEAGKVVVEGGQQERETVDSSVGIQLDRNESYFNRNRSGSHSSQSGWSDVSSSSSFSWSSGSRTPSTPSTTPSTPTTPLPSPHGVNQESGQFLFSPKSGALLPIQEESFSSNGGGDGSVTFPLHRDSTAPIQSKSQFTSKQVSEPSSCMKGSTSSTSKSRSAGVTSHRRTVSFDMVGGGSLAVYQELQNQNGDGNEKFESEIGNLMRKFKSILLKKVRSSVDGAVEVDPESSGQGRKNRELNISAPTPLSSTYNSDPKRAYDWKKAHQLNDLNPSVPHIDSSLPFPPSLDLHQDNIIKSKKFLLDSNLSKPPPVVVNPLVRDLPLAFDPNDAIEQLVTGPPPLLLHQRRSSLLSSKLSSTGAIQAGTFHSKPSSSSVSIQKSKDLNEKDDEGLKMKRRTIRMVSDEAEPQMQFDKDQPPSSSLSLRFSLSLSYPSETITSLTSGLSF